MIYVTTTCSVLFFAWGLVASIGWLGAWGASQLAREHERIAEQHASRVRHEHDVKDIRLREAEQELSRIKKAALGIIECEEC